MSFTINGLDPELQAKYMQWLEACQQNGLRVRGIQGWRDPAYQDQLKASGVSPLSGTESLHCAMNGSLPASRAFDFGVFNADGSYVTDGNDPRYVKAGEFAKSLGLTWGGDFEHPRPDPDHVQL